MTYHERGRLFLIGLSLLCLAVGDAEDIKLAGGMLVGVVAWQFACAWTVDRAQLAPKEGEE